jgi:hypothetical protein
MKKSFTFVLVVIVSFMSCVGPAGEVGPAGPAGQTGPEGPAGDDATVDYPQAIEVTLDFTPENNFGVQEAFGLELYPADVVLVYGNYIGSSSGYTIWYPLPYTNFTVLGNLFIYDFIYTPKEFKIFLKGNANFADLGPNWLNNRVFRIVVVPANFFESGRIVDKSYENITNALGITDDDFVKRDLR